MEKDTTSLPEVWVITGIGYDNERRVLSVCPDEENAQRGKAHYEEDYYDVEIECRYQNTFGEGPYVWSGNFNLEIRPCAKYDKTYLIGAARMYVEKKFLTKYDDPQKCEDFHFNLTKTVDQDGKETLSMRGYFNTSIEPPAGGYGENLGKARREWLIDKINERGIIKLVIPTFD